MKKTRVLIVDDSRSMRMMLSAILSAEPDMEVVGEAGDPFEAREAIKVLNPDVVTLDVEMPRMDGISFLEKLMRLRPTAVVMVSSLTGPNCDRTVQALELGAVDCVGKPEPGDPHPFADLVPKVRGAAKARMASRAPAGIEPRAVAAQDGYKPDGTVVAIGSSTGGVEALSALIANFPANCPPTVITQHMPPKFTKSFAARLDKLCGAHVEEAREGAPLLPGHVYLAPGGEQHLTIVGTIRPVCHLAKGDTVNGHRPSVDVLFHSVAKNLGANALGVILTGMGRDGAQGLSAMRASGARTIGQDEGSALIYGMPRAAFEAGAVQRQLPLSKIGPAILSTTQLRSERLPCR